MQETITDTETGETYTVKCETRRASEVFPWLRGPNDYDVAVGVMVKEKHPRG